MFALSPFSRQFVQSQQGRVKYFLLVTMKLKSRLDGDVDVVGDTVDRANAVLQEYYVAGRGMRSYFKNDIKMDLLLSGHFVTSTSSPPYRIINLWKMRNFGTIPQMMAKLANPPQHMPLYGHLDSLVEEEIQDGMGGYPPEVNFPSPPAPGKVLYYVMMEFRPQSEDLSLFGVQAKAYGGPESGQFVRLASTLSMTGRLNRIIQFWAFEADRPTSLEHLQSLVSSEFEGLGWNDKRFNPRPPIFLIPTPYDNAAGKSRAT